jgi:phage tail-like protein
MALTDSSQIGLANRFKVTIDGKYNLGSWATADGLDVKWDIAEYRAGDNGNDRWYFPANTHYSTIKLTRAASEESKKVKEWLSDNSFKWQPPGFSGRIVLGDSANKEIMHWDLRNLLPTRWAITSFDAAASRVAMETLELVHDGFLNDTKKL